MQSDLKNVVHGREYEIGPQHARATLGFVAEMAPVTARNHVQRTIKRIDTEADGARECIMQDQKFSHFPRSHMPLGNLEVGFHGAAGTQNGHPLGDVHISSNLLAAGQQEVIFEIQHPGRGIGPFDKFSKLEELPALAVVHGGVRDALERMEGVHQRSEKADRTFAEANTGCRALHVEMQAV